MVREMVIYRGKVQGVGFRATCAAIARALPVTGWVRNASDGSVVLEAQGDRADVERLLARVVAERARLIASVERSVIQPVEGESGFRVRV